MLSEKADGKMAKAGLIGENKMQGRNPTAKEKVWMDHAVQVGCIACILVGKIQAFTVPVEYTSIHHIDGKTKPGAHRKSIPLCHGHHQRDENARHVNKTRFEMEFGTEAELLEATRLLVNSYFGVAWEPVES